MQVPGAQNVMVQVTSEGKALEQMVQDVLLLLLLMACGELSDVTRRSPRGLEIRGQRLESEDGAGLRVWTERFFFFWTGRRPLGWGSSSSGKVACL